MSTDHLWFPDHKLTHHTLRQKKETWFLVEFEGRWVTRLQDGEWGTDVWHGARTGVSERLPSYIEVSSEVEVYVPQVPPRPPPPSDT